MNKIEPVSPAEVLIKEFLMPRLYKAALFGFYLDDHIEKLEDVIYNDESITEDIANALSEKLGTTPDFWLNLQASYDARLDKQKP